jgi:hypothetical protein
MPELKLMFFEMRSMVRLTQELIESHESSGLTAEVEEFARLQRFHAMLSAAMELLQS